MPACEDISRPVSAARLDEMFNSYGSLPIKKEGNVAVIRLPRYPGGGVTLYATRLREGQFKVRVCQGCDC